MAFHSNPKHYSSSSAPAVAVAAAYDPSNTTFVQADPSNFREVVQRLTGAPPDPFTRKHPVTNIPGRPFYYKLHERRQSGRNLEIKLGSGRDLPAAMMMVMASSPVSPLDIMMGLPSPAEEEEERSAIAEKGFFYLHPTTPRSSEPELLTLFPLYSPQDDPN